MNRIFLIAAVILSALSYASCSDDAPSQLIWEFSNYDNKEITAVYAPDYVNQVQIRSRYDYSGSITLECSNYQDVRILESYFPGDKYGVEVKKISPNILNIIFSPILKPDDNEVDLVISVTGSNGSGSETGSNIYIVRSPK